MRDDFERSAIERATKLDRLLDHRHHDTSQAAEADTWDDILERNNVTVPGSRFDLSQVDTAMYCLTGLGGGILDLSKPIAGVMRSENVHVVGVEVSC